ncbi:alanine racemase [Salsuginibacillus halophilus]|uniref:Alanine racemase n=1 Tax=Salsuginibacillus halophilus TaxID=517424 RepID=A0A2P8H8B4_9BACI|nr:alanine racemase [Salsuginibacillus halophilus]PSL42458.1 alanine racemase [Salsuginibacillus halophilus]
MAFITTSYRDTWVEVDLSAVASNVARINDIYQDQAALMAVVKADGYGHGAVKVAETALANGAKWLGVAILDEAFELRDAGIEAPILVLGRTRPEDAKAAADAGVSLTIWEKTWLDEAAKVLKEQPVHIHIKVDTGMGRVGVTTADEAVQLACALTRLDQFVYEGVMTHFATADEVETAYFEGQHEKFQTTLQQLEAEAGLPPVVHSANSATALRFPEHCTPLFRYGISMYGLLPSDDIEHELPFPLERAMSLHSRLTQVKVPAADEGVSYGASYRTSGDEWIGTVPIGYGDGWVRYHGHETSEVLVNGQRCPIVGKVCMDQMMIRLPNEAAIGDQVTLIGRQGQEEITIQETASRLGTISYEIPCMLGQRIPRCYK